MDRGSRIGVCVVFGERNKHREVVCRYGRSVRVCLLFVLLNTPALISTHAPQQLTRSKTPLSLPPRSL